MLFKNWRFLVTAGGRIVIGSEIGRCLRELHKAFICIPSIYRQTLLHFKMGFELNFYRGKAKQWKGFSIKLTSHSNMYKTIASVLQISPSNHYFSATSVILLCHLKKTPTKQHLVCIGQTSHDRELQILIIFSQRSFSIPLNSNFIVIVLIFVPVGRVKNHINWFFPCFVTIHFFPILLQNAYLL